MPYPDRFYPVVDSVAWVARLAALGVGTIQLRAKDLDDSQALQLVTDALAVISGTPTKLVVNDYWRAAIVAGAKHLHLGQEDLVDADLNAIRDAGLTLGLSTHDDDELETALRADPDYIALGPIFPTTLKSMRFAPQGIAEDHRMEKAHRRHPAGRDRRHQARAGRRDLRRRRRLDRRRQRRHPKRRPRRAGARLARAERGGRVMNDYASTPTPSSRASAATKRTSHDLASLRDGSLRRARSAGS